jgi:hypothetical protein
MKAEKLPLLGEISKRVKRLKVSPIAVVGPDLEQN